MSVATVRFESESIGRWTNYSLIMPDTGDGPFPVVIQLHGLGDDHRSWIDRTNIVRYAEKLGLVIVFPDGGTSGYLNWKENDRLHRQAWERLIVDDIPNHLRRHYQVTEGLWGIGGLSMGGYGAMRIGLKYPRQFASIWAHSSAFHIAEFLDSGLIDDDAIVDAEVFRHAQRLTESNDAPPVISFDCGVDDDLLDFSRDLHSKLFELGLTHHYAEHPGTHNWEYWDAHVREALSQHAEVLVAR